jgi:hypothetical protein
MRDERFKPLTRGEAAQDELSLRGAKWREGYRAIFMTYEMAEGVNLQRAQALGMIGITVFLAERVGVLQIYAEHQVGDHPVARRHNFFRGLPDLWVCMDPDCGELAEEAKGGSGSAVGARSRRLSGSSRDRRERTCGALQPSVCDPKHDAEDWRVGWRSRAGR